MKMADKVVDWLLKNGADEDKARIYTYGAECFFNELLADLLLFLFALAVNRFFEAVIWLIAFTAVRVNSGGWHARTHTGCILISAATGGVCVLLTPVLAGVSAATVIACTAVSIGIITVIAPVTHINHPVSAAQKAGARRRAIGISCGEGILIVGLLLLRNSFYAPVFTALMSVTVLSVLGALSDKSN